MYRKDQMDKVADVTVRWLSGQISEVHAIDQISEIILSHVPDEDDVDIHVQAIFDSEQFDEITLLTEVAS